MEQCDGVGGVEEGGGQIDMIGIITYVNDDNYGRSLSYMNGLPIKILLCQTDDALVVPLPLTVTEMTHDLCAGSGISFLGHQS